MRRQGSKRGGGGGGGEEGGGGGVKGRGFSALFLLCEENEMAVKNVIRLMTEIRKDILSDNV